ncbi:MAG: hypothetical protein CSA39_04200 [Flavobacteriales bacterium]|nr:MAG: hypothetical protein CSA39_04200 [Flavobacteriales bacterium]
MKIKQLFFLFSLLGNMAFAQLYEAGVFLGGSNYIGDIGSSFYIQPNRIAVGAIARFNFTPRITFRGTGLYTQLHDDDSRAQTNFRRDRGLRFRNSILEAAIGVEFSFFKYSMRRIGFTQTPYIIAQVGAVNYSIAGINGEKKRITSVVLPVGIGYKMHVMNNIAISIESSLRYTFKDVIDGNNHSLGEPSNFGSPSNDDWYVFTGINIVYGFGRPGCYKDNFNR